MPEIQVKNKLITLEELGTAINAKAGVTSVNNQTGAVSITPANIGAVAKSGDTMTGPLGVPSLDINDDWPTLDMRVLKNGSYVDNVMLQASPNGQLTFITYKNGVRSETYFLPTPTSDTAVGYDILTTKAPVEISHGGTGMTDAETFTQFTSNIGLDGRTRILRWGKVYIAHIAGWCNTTITADVTPILSLTDSNYAPSQEVRVVFATLGNESFIAYMNSSGNLCSTKNLEQNTWIYGEIMWFAGK